MTAKPYTPLTSEQEAALRDATTIGDADTTHAAGVLAWRNLWALVDLLRDDAHKALAREDSCINELAAGRAKFASLATELRATAEIVVAATPPGMTYTASLPVDTRNALDHLRSALAAVEAERDEARESTARAVALIAERNFSLAAREAEIAECRRALESLIKFAIGAASAGGNAVILRPGDALQSLLKEIEDSRTLLSTPSSRAALDAMLAQAVKLSREENEEGGWLEPDAAAIVERVARGGADAR